MESPVPKQFMLLAGRPVLMYSIEAFFAFDAGVKIVLVLPGDQLGTWDALCKEHNFTIRHEIVSGGKNRYESVVSGLKSLSAEGLIGIHDGVRPLISPETIRSIYHEASEFGNAIPALRQDESVRMLDCHGNHVVDRNTLRLIQTPQVFKAELIKLAYTREYDEHFTDDATVVEASGIHIHLCEGQPGNLKITRQEDLAVAEGVLEGRRINL